MANNFRFTLADNDKFLFIMHHLLVQNFPGGSIASFSNAEDALHHVLDMGADLVITNHTMGAMTGVDLIKEVRRQRLPVPIIMVSGNRGAEKGAMDAGADEFLHKDFVLPRLIERLNHPNGLLQIR